MLVPDLSEVAILVFIVLLVFGAAKMPALGDAIGRAWKGLRRPGAPDRTAGSRERT